METPLSDRLFERGRRFLGVPVPLICGAMTWVSTPELVASVSRAGGFGCLAGGNSPAGILRGQIEETRRLTAAPFAVNLVAIAPAYREQLVVAAEMKLPYVIFAGSFPQARDVRLIKESGAKVMCFASAESIARRMIGYGADALILEGMEAGGHVGHVSLMVLLQKVLFSVSDVPVFVAGGIASGRLCAHLFLMGASGVQMGTRFAIAKESPAHPAFKKAFARARARDAVSTPQFDSRLPVVAVRALRNKGTEEFGKLQLELLKQLDAGTLHRAEAQMRVEEFWMGALRRAVQDGDIERGSLMAGQSVGLVDREMPVAEIFDEVRRDIEAELARVRGVLA